MSLPTLRLSGTYSTFHYLVFFMFSFKKFVHCLSLECKGHGSRDLPSCSPSYPWHLGQWALSKYLLAVEGVGRERVGGEGEREGGQRTYSSIWDCVFSSQAVSRNVNGMDGKENKHCS